MKHQLQHIVSRYPILKSEGSLEIEISAIQFDSRKVGNGCLFVAIKGTQVDGHAFIDKAVELGASAIVYEKLPNNLAVGVTYLQVIDSSDALGVFASTFYGHPSEKLKLVAVTGTNGKTTIATLLYQLFGAMGYTCGLLSTIENKIGDETLATTMTTPDALTINQLMDEMVKQGCTHCFMEASSHAISQGRMAGLDIDGALFTNISHDHLDYHKTFKAYIEAKKLLFDGLPKSAFALVNIDDKRGNVMLQNCAAKKYTYALGSPADFKGKLMDNSLQGLLMDVDGEQVWFKLLGKFNAYNLLAIYGSAILLGEDKAKVLLAASALAPARGRFQQLVAPNGLQAVVDYAHTPDALKNVLQTVQEVKQKEGKIITVVGCGGNRDKTKRPEMAKIAFHMSEQAIFTADNPRNENPNDIIKDMLDGLSLDEQVACIVEADREAAIKRAIAQANVGDIVLIAGKGHEDYQEVNGLKHHFDDALIAQKYLNEELPDNEVEK